MSFWLLGAPVSSLYGAILFCIQEVPTVFAYLLKSFSRRFSLHRYPREFQSTISIESCTSTGGCSNQLSYGRYNRTSISWMTTKLNVGLTGTTLAPISKKMMLHTSTHTPLIFDGVCYFFFQNLNLSKNKTRTPSNSRPIIASHEPGVRGVIRAASPIRIKRMPTTFLILGLLRIYSLLFLRKFISI